MSAVLEMDISRGQGNVVPNKARSVAGERSRVNGEKFSSYLEVVSAIAGLAVLFGGTHYLTRGILTELDKVLAYASGNNSGGVVAVKKGGNEHSSPVGNGRCPEIIYFFKKGDEQLYTFIGQEIKAGEIDRCDRIERVLPEQAPIGNHFLP